MAYRARIFPARRTRVAKVDATTTATQILAEAEERNGFSVYNDSPAIMYLLMGTQSVSTSLFSVKLEAQDYLEVEYNYFGPVQAVWSEAAGKAMVTEFI